MPKGNTTFSPDLLKKNDFFEVEIGKWGRKHSNTELWCSFCNKAVPFDHGGMNQINQHMKSGKHKTTSNLRFSNTQPKLQQVKGALKLGIPVSTQTTQAEVLWAFKVAEEDFSLMSCNDVGKLFGRMFEGSAVAEKFSMGQSKISYVVRHGLGPVVVKNLVDDINQSDSLFTLLLDETTTKQCVKQMDYLIRYWSVKENEVVTRYL